MSLKSEVKPESKTAAPYRNYSKLLTLSQKMVLLITLVVFVALLPASFFTTYMVTKVIYDRISINSVSINTILCHSAEIKNCLLDHNGAHLEQMDRLMSNYVNSVDSSDEASVALFDSNKQLRVLYNPGGLKDFRASAQQLVNDYSAKEEISWQDNYNIPNQALGFVRDKDDTTIGYIVTGYSETIFNNSTTNALSFLLLTVFLGLVVGIIGATYLARHIKKVLFDMEPEEIAGRLLERDVIFNSVREGIINVNEHGIITLLNAEARSLLAQAGVKSVDYLVGRDATGILSTIRLDDIIKNGHIFSDTRAKIGNNVFIITAVPLRLAKNIIGVVITFRPKSDVEEMANQLTGFKNYATALRAQTHEFMNKMHVIMGLIDLRAYDELKKYTQEIAQSRQSEVAYIVTRLKDITLSGFILAKISRARELDIEFRLTEESELRGELTVPSVHDLVLIIGNLVENAFDALKNYPGERLVSLSILDFANEIVIVIENSGPGMDEATRRQVFDSGFTTKGEGHGLGLSLLRQNIDSLGGSVIVESGANEGTVFTVRLPAKKDGGTND